MAIPGRLFPRRLALALPLLALLAVAGCGDDDDPVKPDPPREGVFLDPTSGHYYEPIEGQVSWTEARDLAAAATYEGLTGHLATITSADENTFVYENLDQDVQRYWLGAWQDREAPGYSEPSGGWTWVTGEPFVFMAWLAGEPNNNGGLESFLAYIWGDTPEWNDVPLSWNVSAGYIIEYDSGGYDSSVWPASHAPLDYAGTGYEIGDLMPDFVASDQFGYDNVELTQFYGATQILHIGGTWASYSRLAEEYLPAIMDSLNVEYDDMTFWVIDVFDHQSNLDAASAAAHAETYGIDYPVLFGAGPDTVDARFEITGYPTFIILDPEMEIRGRTAGGSAGMNHVIIAARAAADAFLDENPGWTGPFE